MESMNLMNKTIAINGIYYRITGTLGDYYEFKAVKNPEKTFDDGVEVNFSYPHRIYYSKDHVHDYYVGKRKWLT